MKMQFIVVSIAFLLMMRFGDWSVTSVPLEGLHSTTTEPNKHFRIPGNSNRPDSDTTPGEDPVVSRCENVCATASISNHVMGYSTPDCTSVLSSISKAYIGTEATEICAKCLCRVSTSETNPNKTNRPKLSTFGDHTQTPSDQYSVYLRIKDQNPLSSKFSQLYDPKTKTSTSGFVPISNPHLRSSRNHRKSVTNRTRAPITPPPEVSRKSVTYSDRLSSRYDDDDPTVKDIPSVEFKSKRLRRGRKINSRQGDVEVAAKTFNNAEKTTTRLPDTDMKRLKKVSDKVPKSKTDNIKYSVPYDPKNLKSTSGFVPIPRPTYKNPSSGIPITSQENSKKKSSSGKGVGDEDTSAVKLIRKASYNDDDIEGNDGILGDGNFEIITGGMFLDPEDNEIGRYFDLIPVGFDAARGRRRRKNKKKRKKFVPSRDFVYPKYFQGDTPTENAMLLPMSYGDF